VGQAAGDGRGRGDCIEAAGHAGVMCEFRY
jgi:hypothetical protein